MQYIVNVLPHHQIVVEASDEEEAKKIALEEAKSATPRKITVTVSQIAPKRWYVVIGHWAEDPEENHLVVQAVSRSEAEATFRDYMEDVYDRPAKEGDIRIVNVLESDTAIMR